MLIDSRVIGAPVKSNSHRNCLVRVDTQWQDHLMGYATGTRKLESQYILRYQTVEKWSQKGQLTGENRETQSVQYLYSGIMPKQMLNTTRHSIGLET
jgi:hypothetical protein